MEQGKQVDKSTVDFNDAAAVAQVIMDARGYVVIPSHHKRNIGEVIPRVGFGQKVPSLEHPVVIDLEGHPYYYRVIAE